MRIIRGEPIYLLLGDIIVFYLSLWITLALRYLELPSYDLWYRHAVPFTAMFVMLVAVYFIAGLYDQHTSYLRNKLPSLVLSSQAVTVVLAALMFLSVPYFGITPKTILVIFLIVSSALIIFWRLVLTRYVGVHTQSHAIALGEHDEMNELTEELNANERYGIRVQHQFSPSDIEVSDKLQEHMINFIEKQHITVLIVDTHHPHMKNITPILYNLLFLYPNITILDASQLYENLFRRIPLSMLKETWFIEHIAQQPPFVYNAYHRMFDIVVSLFLGMFSLLIFPFVALAIKIDDGGPIFSFQKRVGKDNQPLRLVKFRTMAIANDEGRWGSGENKVTRVGKWLRITRIDELPQLWNVLRGGYSLIGPRPEFPAAVKAYAEQIPYYNTRHLITPGLSGWAQLNHHEHPHHGVDVVQTKKKLSYDLYYLKNRSFWLDVEIGLKTIKTLLSAMGR